MSAFTYEDMRVALNRIANQPFEPTGPFYFTQASWDEFLRRFGEPTGFPYVRPDGVLVDPLNPASAVIE
jgi:hypothetical protein